MLTIYQKERLRHIKEALQEDPGSKIVTIHKPLIRHLVEIVQNLSERLHELNLEKKDLQRRLKELESGEELKKLKKEKSDLQAHIAYYRRTYGTDPKTHKKFSELEAKKSN